MKECVVSREWSESAGRGAPVLGCCMLASAPPGRVPGLERDVPVVVLGLLGGGGKAPATLRLAVSWCARGVQLRRFGAESQARVLNALTSTACTASSRLQLSTDRTRSRTCCQQWWSSSSVLIG